MGQFDGMSIEQLKAELAKASAENQKLKGERQDIKLTDKGGVSVYGLGRFPVTLYREQWVKLLGMAERINSFMDSNKTKLDLIAKDHAEAKAAAKAAKVG